MYNMRGVTHLAEVCGRVQVATLERLLQRVQHIFQRHVLRLHLQRLRRELVHRNH